MILMIQWNAIHLLTLKIIKVMRNLKFYQETVFKPNRINKFRIDQVQILILYKKYKLKISMINNL